MEVKELVEKVKKLNVTDCETCPFWIKDKFENYCKFKGPLCIGKENKIEELLIIEEYLKEKEHEI